MDSEIEAMSQIAKALEPLDADATRRVLKWAIERFQPRQTAATAPGSEASPQAGAAATAATPRNYLSVHELFDKAAPETGLEKILVVAYWHQVVQGLADWDSQSINTDLKHLGHPSGNITRDLDTLISRSPRQVMQTRKQGTTKQARKLYTLTREGIKSVEALLLKSDPLLS
jgi:hypothetical protein